MSNPADLVYTISKDKLPDEWSLATISDLVGKGGVFVDGDWVESKDQDPDGDVRLIQLADIGDGEYRNKSERFLTYEKAIQLGCTFLQKGDVLIARMPDPLGRACIFPGDQKKSVTVVDVAVVRPAANEFDTRWLMYFVNAPAFRSAVASMQSGSTRKRISRGNLSKIALPVPPLDQQTRIVAEIEKQFSRLDEAVANLKRVKANLKRYKAAVLKAAVEGRLVETEAERARREGRSFETGAQLLQRILETRRSQWQGKGKYKEPAAPDTTDLPELPDGWMWATVDLVCDQIVDCPHSTARFKTGGFPCIDTTWMTQDGLVFERARYVDDVTYHGRIARLEPKPGDIVFAREGTIGTAVVVPEQIKPCLGQRVMLLRPSTHFLGSLLRHILHSEIVKSQYLAQALGSTVPHINVGDVKAFRIPVPPLAEQHRIVAEVDRHLSLQRATEAQVDANLQRGERLRQSVLQRAFSIPSVSNAAGATQ